MDYWDWGDLNYSSYLTKFININNSTWRLWFKLFRLLEPINVVLQLLPELNWLLLYAIVIPIEEAEIMQCLHDYFTHAIVYLMQPRQDLIHISLGLGYARLLRNRWLTITLQLEVRQGGHVDLNLLYLLIVLIDLLQEMTEASLSDCSRILWTIVDIKTKYTTPVCRTNLN